MLFAIVLKQKWTTYKLIPLLARKSAKDNIPNRPFCCEALPNRFSAQKSLWGGGGVEEALDDWLASLIGKGGRLTSFYLCVCTLSNMVRLLSNFYIELQQFWIQAHSKWRRLGLRQKNQCLLDFFHSLPFMRKRPKLVPDLAKTSQCTLQQKTNSF